MTRRLLRTAAFLVFIAILVPLWRAKAQPAGSAFSKARENIRTASASAFTGAIKGEQPLAGRPSGVTYSSASIYASYQITGTTTTPPSNQQTACGVIWGSGPGLVPGEAGVEPGEEPLPLWLTTPETAEDLRTNIPYNYLAGKLISAGVVDARTCPSGGLQGDGMANACGLAAAREEVTLWQNQFDEAIYQAAIRNRVPAQLLKRIFAQESQFWPGGSDAFHFGIGHVTQPGLDPLLVWDPGIYQLACKAVFSAETCAKNYLELSESERAMLRGYLLSDRFKITCENCAYGIDLPKAFGSIDLFARLLVANCQQVNQITRNLTELTSGQVSSYEDLWRFTLVNYNVGPGCLSTTLTNLKKSELPFTWGNVGPHLTGFCTMATTYVGVITQ